MPESPTVAPPPAWQLALAMGQERATLAAARLARAAALRDARPTADLDVEIARATERVSLIRSRVGPTLPEAHLAARVGLSDLELEIVWLLASRSPLFAPTPRVPEPPLTIAAIADALAESDVARLEVMRALMADARLRRAGLVHLDSVGDAGARREVVQPAGFLVWWLAGQRVLSERLAPHVERVPPALTLDHAALPADQRAALRKAAPVLVPAPSLAADPRTAPFGYDYQAGALILLSGAAGTGKTLVARALAGELQRHAMRVDGAALGAMSAFERWHLCELLAAEALVTGDLILFDRADLAFPASHDDPEVGHVRLEALVQRAPIGVIGTCEDPSTLATALRGRAFFAFELAPISRRLALEVWQNNAPYTAAVPDMRPLSVRYALSGRSIQSALNVAARLDGATISEATLELACHAQQSSAMSDTTQRVRYQRQRADLELSPALAQAIDDIIATESIRERTLESWGLATRFQKGLGLICLFDGEPGTGKTLAAEVIASELALPLYAVNIPNVVSKWVGETEKNLQRIFDDASRSRCVLLFDEADALFGKRTGVERASDRYANMEINVLLQLVEGYRGLVVLTTNLKEAIDPAFVRRFTFKLSFPDPDAKIREGIWRRLLPDARNLARDVDARELAREFELTGGAIKNVILRASFRAASSGRSLTQAALRDAALDECRALGKLVRSKIP